MPQLFYSAGSPYARICRMALREGGLMDRIEEAETTLRDPAAVMLPHNPVGRVPALLPEAASGMAAYGRVLGLLDGIAVWNREMRRPEHERSPGVIALEEMRATRLADALERKVAAGGFTGLDAGFLALAAVLGYGERRHTVWRWREGRPSLSAWFSAAAARPAFQETLPPLSGI